MLVKTVGTIRASPPPPPITMLIFHGDSSIAGAREKGSERRTHVARVTMEACTVNSLLFAQNLTSVPKCFDPDCRRSMSVHWVACGTCYSKIERTELGGILGFHMKSRPPCSCLQTMKWWPCWCPDPILLELKAIIMLTSSFVFVEKHGC